MPMSSLVGPVTAAFSSALDRYNEDVKVYKKRFSEYWTNQLEHERLAGFCFPLKIALVNKGRAPADNVQVVAALPEGAAASDEPPLPPSPPEIPERPTGDSLVDSMRTSRLPNLDNIRFAGEEISPPYWGPVVREGKIEYGVDELGHGLSLRLPKMFVTLPRDPGEYTV